MRRPLVVLAVLVALGSMVWGFRILTDVTPATDGAPDLSCGSVLGSLRGEPSYGGEQAYPADWVDQCRDAAQDDVAWLVVPATSGVLSVLFLLGTFVAVARTARREGRWTGSLL